MPHFGTQQQTGKASCCGSEDTTSTLAPGGISGTVSLAHTEAATWVFEQLDTQLPLLSSVASARIWVSAEWAELVFLASWASMGVGRLCIEYERNTPLRTQKCLEDTGASL